MINLQNIPIRTELGREIRERFLDKWTESPGISNYQGNEVAFEIFQNLRFPATAKATWTI